ncbi:hypothetical protein ACQ4WX_41355 [Streptomyces lasalocidi]
MSPALAGLDGYELRALSASSAESARAAEREVRGAADLRQRGGAGPQ